MARFSTLTALLVTMFIIAACGGGGPQGSERDTPAEPQQSHPAQEEPAPARAPAENEAGKNTKENARRSEESSGLTRRGLMCTTTDTTTSRRSTALRNGWLLAAQ